MSVERALIGSAALRMTVSLRGRGTDQREEKGIVKTRAGGRKLGTEGWREGERERARNRREKRGRDKRVRGRKDERGDGGQEERRW